MTSNMAEEGGSFVKRFFEFEFRDGVHYNPSARADMERAVFNDASPQGDGRVHIAIGADIAYRASIYTALFSL